MNNLKIFPIKVPLDSEAYDRAEKFASEQATLHQSEQVYWNTLAVWTVNRFLQWMEIDTDLSQGDSWHPVVRSFNDVADLVLPPLGKLECRPVLPGETSVHLPVEVREDRMGCVAVQFQEKQHEAQLLGCYVSHAETDELPEQLLVHDLSPLDILLSHVTWLTTMKAIGLNNLKKWLEKLLKSDDWQEHGNICLAIGASPVFRSQRDANKPRNVNALIEQLQNENELSRQEAAACLGQIGADNPNAIAALTNVLKSDSDENTRWQAALSLGLIAPDHPKAGFGKGKLIDLGIDHPVALVISCRRESQKEIALRLQVYPTGPQSHLPLGCKLIVLDEDGETWREIEAQDADNCIQKCFSIELGDRFGVSVRLDEVNYTELLEL